MNETTIVIQNFDRPLRINSLECLMSCLRDETGDILGEEQIKKIRAQIDGEDSADVMIKVVQTLGKGSAEIGYLPEFVKQVYRKAIAQDYVMTMGDLVRFFRMPYKVGEDSVMRCVDRIAFLEARRVRTEKLIESGEFNGSNIIVRHTRTKVKRLIDLFESDDSEFVQYREQAPIVDIGDSFARGVIRHYSIIKSGNERPNMEDASDDEKRRLFWFNQDLR